MGQVWRNAKLLALALGVALALSACRQDETVSGYAGGIWVLSDMDGGPAPEGITLDLTEERRVAGQAPCNRYFGDQTAPYPWFSTGPLASTRMFCERMDAETRYLELLGRMTLAEGQGDVLILSNDADEMLVFARQEE